MPIFPKKKRGETISGRGARHQEFEQPSLEVFFDFFLVCWYALIHDNLVTGLVRRRLPIDTVVPSFFLAKQAFVRCRSIHVLATYR